MVRSKPQAVICINTNGVPIYRKLKRLEREKSPFHGDGYNKLDSCTRMIINPDLAAMIRDNPVGYGKPQSGARFFGRIEWIEYIMEDLRLNASTGVGNHY
jgi:hypothetical protein